MKTALVCGAGGFIGNHLVKKLKDEGFWVRGVDLKYPLYSSTLADDFVIGDLREQDFVCHIIDKYFDEIYQLAADMGGAGYIFTGNHDADIMYNSALINLNVLNTAWRRNISKIFYASSACIYPEYNQEDRKNPKTAEESAYPAQPDSEYGWEKLFSERLYLSYGRNYGMDINIARFHNIFGPENAWNNGLEKVPAALCRKIAMAEDNGEIEIWGDGLQTRSFLYIDECLKGMRLLMDQEDFSGPVNIGSEEMVSINRLAEIIMEIADKNLTMKHVSGPEGVRGRTSDNRLLKEKLGWKPESSLKDGLNITYKWIEQQLKT